MRNRRFRFFESRYQAVFYVNILSIVWFFTFFPLFLGADSEERIPSADLIAAAVNRENLELVLDWTGQELSGKGFHQLATILRERKRDLSAQVSAAPLASDILCFPDLPKHQQERIVREAEGNLKYLGGRPSFPLPLETLEFSGLGAWGADTQDFRRDEGFSPGIASLSRENHSMPDIESYCLRRLGTIVARLAAHPRCRIVFSDGDIGQTLRALGFSGSSRVVRMNLLYANWGKSVYVVFRPGRMEILIVDILGEDHFYHIQAMLHLAAKGRTDLSPRISRLHVRSSRKVLFSALYEQEARAQKALFPIQRLALGYWEDLASIFCEAEKRRRLLLLAKLFFPRRPSAEGLATCLPSPYAGIDRLAPWLFSEEGEAVMAEITRAFPAAAKHPFLLPYDRREKILRTDIFSCLTREGPAFIAHVGAAHSLYGDMAREVVAAFYQIGVHDVFFSGSTGGLSPDLNLYQVTVPAHFLDDLKARLPVKNALEPIADSRFPRPIRHGVIRSPAAETWDWLQANRTTIETVDVETSRIAEFFRDKTGRLFCCHIVTDFPGGIRTSTLDERNLADKSKAKREVAFHFLRAFGIRIFLSKG
jgi:hypothetical protein